MKKHGSVLFHKTNPPVVLVGVQTTATPMANLAQILLSHMNHLHHKAYSRSANEPLALSTAGPGTALTMQYDIVLSHYTKVTPRR